VIRVQGVERCLGSGEASAYGRKPSTTRIAARSKPYVPNEPFGRRPNCVEQLRLDLANGIRDRAQRLRSRYDLSSLGGGRQCSSMAVLDVRCPGRLGKRNAERPKMNGKRVLYKRLVWSGDTEASLLADG